jgi:hypothetical protein
MSLVFYNILILLVFSVQGLASDSCEMPSCDLPSVFQDLRDREQLIDDSPRLIRGAIEGLTSLFRSGDEHCPTDYEAPPPSDDGLLRVSDIFTGGPTSDVGSPSIITQERASQLFASLRDDCRIPFQMNTDGCYHRAHAMAKLAGDQGINVAKAFFKADSFGGAHNAKPSYWRIHNTQHTRCHYSRCARAQWRS